MHVIKARNVHQALPEALYQIKQHGVRRESRNGPVLKFPGPCTIEYARPLERVLFWAERDANPTFHLLEALWMLAGRNDVQFPASIVSRMAQYSDDGHTLNGAYGHRWRRHFRSHNGQPIDQLLTIARALRANPDCRRQVLSMWDGHHDLGLNSKDLPCNTHVYFSRDEEGRLDMMVCNRSNDLVWGALGANAVHFSVLQEFMAALIGCEVGRYWQVSNNMHLYLEHHQDLMELLSQRAFPNNDYVCPYAAGLVEPTPLVSGDPMHFLADTQQYIDQGPTLGIRDAFIRHVATPIGLAYSEYRASNDPGRFRSALLQIDRCRASDWKLACQEWYGRREAKARQLVATTEE